MKPSKNNVTGVESHDHTNLAALPEYHRAAKALDDLVHAINQAEVDSGQEQWLKTVEQMAASLSYGDCCRLCRGADIYWPYKVEFTSPGDLRCYYRCREHKWTCGYSVNIGKHLS